MNVSNKDYLLFEGTTWDAKNQSHGCHQYTVRNPKFQGLVGSVRTAEKVVYSTRPNLNAEKHESCRSSSLSSRTFSQMRAINMGGPIDYHCTDTSDCPIVDFRQLSRLRESGRRYEKTKGNRGVKRALGLQPSCWSGRKWRLSVLWQLLAAVTTLQRTASRYQEVEIP
jgi:hypothetical protein